MNAAPQTKKAQRAASTEKLLAAALNRFVGHGYRHTTVEAIALSASLSKGAVYFYFGSKPALLLRLLDQVEAVVVDEMEARIASAGPSAPGMLIAFVHGQAMLGVERWEYVLLLILMSLEFRGAGGEIEARVTGIYARLYDAIEAIIEEGKAAGVFSTDLGTREQAAIVMAGHDGTFLEWYRRGRRLDGEELVRALRAATLGGLQVSPIA